MRKLLGILMFVTILMVAGQAMADTVYQFVDLGEGMAFAVNNSNQIVGNSGSSPTFQPALFYNGTTTILDSRVGYAKDINDAGQIVGNSGGTTNNNAFFYENGIFSLIGDPDGSPSEAFGINSQGQIAGRSNSMAAIYENGTWVDLGIGHVSTAYDINDHGQIMGMDRLTWEPFFLDESIEFLLPGNARKINIDGKIIGSLTTDFGPRQPYIYNDGIYTILPEEFGVMPLGINNLGFVVGASKLWKPDGSIIDLNAYVDPQLKINLGAFDINDNGTIVGGFNLNDVQHAFALYPIDSPPVVPEPSSLALLAMGSLFLVRRRKAKK